MSADILCRPSHGFQIMALSIAFLALDPRADMCRLSPALATHSHRFGELKRRHLVRSGMPIQPGMPMHPGMPGILPGMMPPGMPGGQKSHDPPRVLQFCPIASISADL